MYDYNTNAATPTTGCLIPCLVPYTRLCKIYITYQSTVYIIPQIQHLHTYISITYLSTSSYLPGRPDVIPRAPRLALRRHQPMSREERVEGCIGALRDTYMRVCDYLQYIYMSVLYRVS